MRRREREVTDLREIVEIIDRCEILRVGLADGDFPYIVPMNFAYEVQGEQLSLYIHGASAGRKFDLMKKNGRCSFEMDIPSKMVADPARGSVTMLYQSVMGTAELSFLEGEEKMHGIHVLLDRDPSTRNIQCPPASVSAVSVVKLTVGTLSAKRNPAK